MSSHRPRRSRMACHFRAYGLTFWTLWSDIAERRNVTVLRLRSYVYGSTHQASMCLNYRAGA